MTLTGLHKITGDFDEALIAFVAEGEDHSAKIYFENEDTPTIGYGFSIIDKKTGNLRTDIISNSKFGLTFSNILFTAGSPISKA